MNLVVRRPGVYLHTVYADREGVVATALRRHTITSNVAGQLDGIERQEVAHCSRFSAGGQAATGCNTDQPKRPRDEEPSSSGVSKRLKSSDSVGTYGPTFVRRTADVGETVWNFGKPLLQRDDGTRVYENDGGVRLETICVSCETFTYREQYRSAVKRISEEALVMCRVGLHKHLVPCFWGALAKVDFCIWWITATPTPLCPLRQWSRTNRRSKHLSPSKILFQVLDGLKHIHGLGIVHGAVNPDSIFVYRDAEWGEHCKLGGFHTSGTSPLWRVDQKTEYCSPEQLTQTAPCDSSVDIWAALLTFIVLKYRLYFFGKGEPKAIFETMCCVMNVPEDVQASQGVVNTVVASSVTEYVFAMHKQHLSEKHTAWCKKVFTFNPRERPKAEDLQQQVTRDEEDEDVTIGAALHQTLCPNPPTNLKIQLDGPDAETLVPCFYVYPKAGSPFAVRKYGLEHQCVDPSWFYDIMPRPTVTQVDNRVTKYTFDEDCVKRTCVKWTMIRLMQNERYGPHADDEHMQATQWTMYNIQGHEKSFCLVKTVEKQRGGREHVKVALSLPRHRNVLNLYTCGVVCQKLQSKLYCVQDGVDKRLRCHTLSAYKSKLFFSHILQAVRLTLSRNVFLGYISPINLYLREDGQVCVLDVTEQLAHNSSILRFPRRFTYGERLTIKTAPEIHNLSMSAATRETVIFALCSLYRQAFGNSSTPEIENIIAKGMNYYPAERATIENLCKAFGVDERQEPYWLEDQHVALPFKYPISFYGTDKKRANPEILYTRPPFYLSPSPTCREYLD
ncbi:UNVERIFIED_CONTAM: hypothetical protein FKN15_003180 [Acipenser sinensis]